jgi:hypothetical protein
MIFPKSGCAILPAFFAGGWGNLHAQTKGSKKGEPTTEGPFYWDPRSNGQWVGCSHLLTQEGMICL